MAEVAAPEEIQVTGETPQVPEVPVEQAPAEPAEAQDDLSDVLAAFTDSVDATPGLTGIQAPADNTDPYAGLTPQQIADQGAERERQRLTQGAQSDAEQRMITGTREALNNSKQTIEEELKRAGLPAETILDLLPKLNTRLDEFHGEHRKLRGADHQAGIKLGSESVFVGVLQGTASLLGEKDAEQLHKDMTGKPWSEFFDAVVNKAAEKKGYVTRDVLKKDYVSRTTVEKQLRAYDAALKPYNLSLKALNGNGGETPIRPGATSFSGNKPYSQMTADERKALSNEQRDAAVAREATSKN